MNAKYCTCGGKTEYSIKPPLFCGSCGQPFDKLFKAKKVSIQPPTDTEIKKTITKIPVRHKIETISEDDEDISYDEGYIESRAAELASEFTTEDFFSIEKGEDNKVSLEDILDPKKDINVGMRKNVITDVSQLS